MLKEMSTLAVLQFDENPSAQLSDGYEVYLGVLSQDRTITMPDVSASDGAAYTVTNSPQSAGVLTVDGFESQLVLGLTNKTLAAGSAVSMVSFGGAWYSM